ncbi:hypothetical protein C882_4250 [Caenispirillum salinarum AK4]|uniref:Antitoxin SocA-like Panacea domain-containing protein n=1 Tax=Caenispirillum salinarum AK4 TaxID=1238182 RepID=K9HKK7_9PROT|nr:type II toxin-antitoxin system antitoxin SocA domain-containing protein [Caenispirillum salinarum]EKV30913.1 hypothetical protein C882_4250 [Caenispirillum salinarum AK4]
MRRIAADSSFDVAFWMLDRALDDNEYLQPQKLHRLLYLAQAYFAVASRGRKLMPATFVADQMGPLEPTIYRAFENGRPDVETRRVPDDAKQLLDSVWRKFGAHSAEHLTKLTKNHAPYRDAIAANGPGEEITLKSMMDFYGRKGAADRKPEAGAGEAGEPGAAPALTDVLRPRVMRSHKGRPVNVHKWMPRSLGSGRTEE